MHVRDVMLRLSGWPGLGDRSALLDRCTALHEERPEVGERRLVAVASSNRHGETVRGNLTGEGDFPIRRSTHNTCTAERDVHAAVLPARVLVVRDRELAQDGAVDGP
jgi:hypothetical protein